MNLVLLSGFPKAEKFLKENPEIHFGCESCPSKFHLLRRAAKEVSLLFTVDQHRYIKINKARLSKIPGGFRPTSRVYDFTDLVSRSW